MKSHLQKRIAEIKAVKLDKRRERRYIAQLKRQGWCNMDCWSLDIYLAGMMLPMLRELFRFQSGHPVDCTPAAWKVIQGKILYAIERYAKDDILDICDAAQGKKNRDVYVARFNLECEKMREGMRLFGEYFGALWS